MLQGATLIARYLKEKNVSVLVHCSDGWDRTPQLTSLAQVLLDPFYRTRDGFKVYVLSSFLVWFSMQLIILLLIDLIELRNFIKISFDIKR